MRDIVTPVTQEEVKTVIRRCLEQAALVNYQRLSEYAKLEGTFLILFLFPGFPQLPERITQRCSPLPTLVCLNFLVNSVVM